MAKRGPKTAASGPCRPRTISLDEITERKAAALGANLSDALRQAVRVAYNLQQSTAADVSDATALAQLGTLCDRLGLEIGGIEVAVERNGNTIHEGPLP